MKVKSNIGYAKLLLYDNFLGFNEPYLENVAWFHTDATKLALPCQITPFCHEVERVMHNRS